MERGESYGTVDECAARSKGRGTSAGILNVNPAAGGKSRGTCLGDGDDNVTGIGQADNLPQSDVVTAYDVPVCRLVATRTWLPSSRGDLTRHRARRNSEGNYRQN